MKINDAVRFLLKSEEIQAMYRTKKHFSDTATKIWKEKYAAVEEKMPEDTTERIVSEICPCYDHHADIKTALSLLMNNRLVAFNSPVYFNLGVKENPQLAACFILGVDDTMESIAELSATEMNIFRQGSGSGVNYSALRHDGAPLSNGGTSSGPLSFMKALDTMAGVVKSGGKRRAARMAILDSDHEDIWDFIECKAKEERRLKDLASIDKLPSDHYDNPAAFYQNTNHTVRLWDHDLADNKKLIHAIAEAIWECGDPGVHFANTVQNAAPEEISAQICASNPCSEVLGVNNSACNLASINVAHGYFRDEEGVFNFERLNAVATALSWAMDRIIDLSSYPTEKIKENVLKYRPLGMGFTGFGELCMLMGIPYGSDCCCDLVEEITLEMYQASKVRDEDEKNYQHLAIAPTGTISLFLDAESTGIEPIYAEKVTKYLAGGGTIEQEPECIKFAREKYGDKVVCCATGENAVNAIEHIDVVSSAQEFVCGGISKTVNLPHDTTVEEIEALIRYAWKSCCKTMSFYRDGSKAIQPLRIEKEEKEEEPELYDLAEQTVMMDPYGRVIYAPQRMRPDQQRQAITRKFSVGGEEGYITVGLYSDGSPCEVFIRISKIGSTIQGFLDQLGIAWSLALQHGVPLAALVEKALGTKFDPSGYTGDELRFASSVLDYLAKWLSSEFLVDLEEGEEEDEIEPACAEPTTATAEGTREIIRQSYEGAPCRACGAITQPSGTCWVCPACGETTGCS